MSGERQRPEDEGGFEGRGAEGDFEGQGAEEGLEEQLRELLAEDAYTIQPSPAPYPAIRRRGMVERRHRVAVAGAALVTLAAAPVGAYALTGPDGSGGTAAPQTSASATRSATPTPSPSPTPTGPKGPATPGQLLDGITLAQASDGLEMCLADKRWNGSASRIGAAADLGKADGYRIILAMNSTGDSNAPGDGMFVVAVKEKPYTRLICNIKNGEASGLNTSVGDDLESVPGAGPVMADPNGGKLHRQSMLDDGNWKLPFRWGVIGRVEPSVAKVTVSYGGATVSAVLDHGWFVATGILNQHVTKAPHIEGYDAAGKRVYDSDQDNGYEKTL
ncbi:hypothetical protein [Streptomyces sp. NL15-2K]|uniref:hypothetical protein n=1 Tax=Streptomyces sp. NL15-2K TaxID=376149 RepID=UPI000FF9A4ED|nr:MULTISPECIES: hypothetical protein [Actinomycetes]WKX08963.1 hypothetical protein Q4V64_16255 [Kutzneria buriramensis]GCB49543.1 hypothetical protein SNL152K_6882 [Streptomyces sp. NL15-2K]